MLIAELLDSGQKHAGMTRCDMVAWIRESPTCQISLAAVYGVIGVFTEQSVDYSAKSRAD
jgi:hypothetical protein